MKKIALIIAIISSLVFSEDSTNVAKPKANSKSLDTSKQISTNNSISIERLYEKSEDNIRQSDRILNLMEIFVGFVGFVIAVLGIAGGFILRKISRTRRRLEIGLDRLSQKWGDIQVEYDNLKVSFQKEMGDFRQILFFVTEGDNSSDAGRHDEAVSYYQQALKIKKDEPEVIAKLGHTLIRAGKYEDAIDKYQEGLELCKNNINLLNGLARAYRKNSKYEKAKIYYEKALDIDSNFIWALSGLGQVFMHQKQFDDAIDNYKKLLRTEDFYLTHINLGILYYCQNESLLAKNHFERALSLIDLGAGKNENKWLKLCKFLALVGLGKKEETEMVANQLTKMGLTPPNLLSIKFRLNILYENTKEVRFKEFIDFFN
jgi:tetratricopeptide (TPR) repeat protein